MNYQDMLSRLGFGSAHPGGYAATVQLLEQKPFKSGSKVLDVGCGTGRSACMLAKQGYQVTGLDIRPLMIAKAKKRATMEGVQVEFLTGDVGHLPFRDNTFDVIFIESLTVFVNTASALRECYRVLREEGQILDREMMAAGMLPMSIYQKIQNFYGVTKVPSKHEWKQLFEEAGFQDVTIKNYTSVSTDMKRPAPEEPDHYQIMDTDIFNDPTLIDMLTQNTEIMIETADFLAHGVIMGVKR